MLMSRVITRKQAIARDHSAKTIRGHLRRGHWQVLQRGVYLMHSGQPTWRERLLAAVLACGEGAVASGACALALWGLSDSEPAMLTVAIPADRRVRSRLLGVRVRRRRRLTRATQQGIPVTGLHQTVIDVLGTGMDPDSVVALLVKACRPKKSTPTRLREELQHHPLHPLRHQLDALLEAAELGLGSVAEWRYLQDVARAHGLPPTTPQAEMVAPRHADLPGCGPTAPDPLAPRRFQDFLDEEHDVVIEIDGDLYHRERLRQDRARDRQNAGVGRVTLRAGMVDVLFTPCQLAADIAVVARQRGWPGLPVACGENCGIMRDPRLQADAA